MPRPPLLADARETCTQPAAKSVGDGATSAKSEQRNGGWSAQERQQGFPRKKFQLPAPVWAPSVDAFAEVTERSLRFATSKPKGALFFSRSCLPLSPVVATPRPKPYFRSSLLSSCEVSRAEIAAIVPPKCFIPFVLREFLANDDDCF